MENIERKKGTVNGAEAMGSREPECFRDGEELAGFLKDTFPVTAEEGQKLMEYIQKQGCLLGHMEGGLYRGSREGGQEVRWEQDTIDDVVDAASEWNYEMLREAEESRRRGKAGLKEKGERLSSVLEDERILDGLFDRTKYGKEIRELAEALADAVILEATRGGDIDKAAGMVAGQIKDGRALQQELPSPKRSPGRQR